MSTLTASRHIREQHRHSKISFPNVMVLSSEQKSRNREDGQGKPLQVLVCGSRGYKDIHRIKNELQKLPKDAIIIEGGMDGAERSAAFVATCCGIPVTEYSADWDSYGQAAGTLRNDTIIRSHKLDIALIFHRDLAHSRNEVKHMISLLEKKMIPYKVIR